MIREGSAQLMSTLENEAVQDTPPTSFRSWWASHRAGTAETAIFVLLMLLSVEMIRNTFWPLRDAFSTMTGYCIWAVIINLLCRHRLVGLLTVLLICAAFFRLYMPYAPNWDDQFHYQLLKPIAVLAGQGLYTESLYTYLPTNLLANLPFALLGIDIRWSYMLMCVLATLLVFRYADPRYRLIGAVLTGLNPIVLLTSIRLENNAVTMLALLLAFVALRHAKRFAIYMCVFLALAFCSRQFVTISGPLFLIYCYRRGLMKPFWGACGATALLLLPFALADFSSFLDGTLFYHTRTVPERLWAENQDVTTLSFLTALTSLGLSHEAVWERTPSKLLQGLAFVGLIAAYWRRSRLRASLEELSFFICANGILVTTFAHTLRIMPGYFVVLLIPAMFCAREPEDDSEPLPSRWRTALHALAVSLILAYVAVLAIGRSSYQAHVHNHGPRTFHFVAPDATAPDDGIAVPMAPFHDQSPTPILNVIDGYGWIASRNRREFRVLVPDLPLVVEVQGHAIVQRDGRQALAPETTAKLTREHLNDPAYERVQIQFRYVPEPTVAEEGFPKLRKNYYILPFPLERPAVQLGPHAMTAIDKVTIHVK